MAAHPLHGHVQMNSQRKHHLFLQPRKPFPGQITDIPCHAQDVVPHDGSNLVLPDARLLEFMDMALESGLYLVGELGFDVPFPQAVSQQLVILFLQGFIYVKALQKGFRSGFPGILPGIIGKYITVVRAQLLYLLGNPVRYIPLPQVLGQAREGHDDTPVLSGPPFQKRFGAAHLDI